MSREAPQFPTPQTPPPPEVPFPEIHWDWEALYTQPQVDPSAWIAPGAVVMGRVFLGPRSSVWYGSVIRGDHEWIRVGADSNVQDGCVLHVDPGYPCDIGERVTLGHRAVVHASVVEDDALIGINATILSRCTIGAGALVAAGAVVREGTVVPPRTLWAGCPAKQYRELTAEQIERMSRNWKHYANNAAAFRAWSESHPPYTT